MRLQDHFQRLRQAYPGSKLLIVSNTAGTDSDQQQKEAALLEANTGIKVLRHSTKKPGCQAEVMAYFKAHPDAGVTRPEQIAVVGDRLSTDIMMANMMGSYGVWVRDGVTGRGFVSPHRLKDVLMTRKRLCFKLMDIADARLVCQNGRQAAELPTQKRIQCTRSSEAQPL
jgi:phosphatidylglycerophosphatase GEP4